MKLKTLLLAASVALLACATDVKAQYAGFEDYEIYTTAKENPYSQTKAKSQSGLFKRTPKNAITSNGLGGLFVGETADKLESHQLILSGRYKYHELTSTKGQAFYTTEDGSVSSFDTSLTWVGDWAEFAITVPVQKWELSAPKTFGTRANSDNGLGNISFGFKYTDFVDHSYYRFAVGFVYTSPTGNSENMFPAGANRDHTTKLFTTVTTKETDKATANLELGAILNKEDEDWFLYNFGVTYEVTQKVSFIGELVGEVAGGHDKDNMDLVFGFRIAPSKTFNFEAAYYRNLRTYRAYGWDNQFQVGGTLLF